MLKWINVHRGQIGSVAVVKAFDSLEQWLRGKLGPQVDELQTDVADNATAISDLTGDVGELPSGLLAISSPGATVNIGTVQSTLATLSFTVPGAVNRVVRIVANVRAISAAGAATDYASITIDVSPANVGNYDTWGIIGSTSHTMLRAERILTLAPGSYTYLVTARTVTSTHVVNSNSGATNYYVEDLGAA
jgi:hypothetical protein